MMEDGNRLEADLAVSGTTWMPMERWQQAGARQHRDSGIT